MITRRTLARRSRTFLLPKALCIAFLATGCGGSVTTPDETPSLDKSIAGPEVPTSPPSIRGTITKLVPGDSVARTTGAAGTDASVSCPPSCASDVRQLRSVLVEDVPGAAGGGGDKSVVTILVGARVLRRGAAGVVPAGFDDLRVGQQVSAWFDGPVLNSYPTQAKGAVLIIER